MNRKYANVRVTDKKPTVRRARNKRVTLITEVSSGSVGMTDSGGSEQVVTQQLVARATAVLIIVESKVLNEFRLL
jgi:hypothetical protein